MGTNIRKSRGFASLTLAVLAAGIAFSSQLRADDSTDKAPTSTSANSGLYVKVLLSTNPKMSKLKPGDALEGQLARDVYSSDRKVFSAGSRVRLTVDHLERRKRTPNDHWPWVVNAFTPRHENYPVFREATVTESRVENHIQVSMIALSRLRDVYAQAKKNNPGKTSPEDKGAVETGKSNQKTPAMPTMVLEAFGFDDTKPASSGTEIAVTTERPDLVPTGTRCKILLLGSVSASHSRPGDPVTARLLEPVILNSKVALPAGSLITGKVVKRSPPKMLSRAGSLYLSFTDLTLPEGSHFVIAASPAGAELNTRSHTRIDAEGGLHGEHPGKAWMAINLGMTTGVAKVADDGIQLVIEAIVSTATDVSTAGTGRIVAGCASAIYLATRHGRDVMLPRFSEMDITLERPVSLTSQTAMTASTAAGGK